jgi:hypothetical protein
MLAWRQQGPEVRTYQSTKQSTRRPHRLEHR